MQSDHAKPDCGYTEPVPTLEASIASLTAWAAGFDGFRISAGDPLSDDEIDAGFRELRAPYPSPANIGSADDFSPLGSYRAFLRRCNGLRLEVCEEGHWRAADDTMFRVFDLETLVRVNLASVYLGTPLHEVGAGRSKKRVWLSRNHLVAFAGGEHAPDALWVFDVSAGPEDESPIHELDQDAAMGRTLFKDEHGAWLAPSPPVAESSFETWLGSFADGLTALDPTDYV